MSDGLNPIADISSDGLGMQPRIGEPETSGETGMSFAGPELTAGGLLASGAPNIPDTSLSPAGALQEPAHWTYDFNPASGSSRATFNGEVTFVSGGGSDAGVSSFNGRDGAVTFEADDLAEVGGALLASPAFIGSPQAPTPAPGDASTAIATTAFVGQAIASTPKVSSFNGRTGAVVLTAGDVTGAGGAPAASPTLTGVPTAPTAAQGVSTSQVATTAYVENAIAAETVLSFNGRRGAVALTLSDVQSVGGAPIASPNFTGTPAGPTAAPGTATSQLATTAFVENAVTEATTGVVSFNGRSGVVTLQPADVSNAGAAMLASPTFTGSPQAPTPSAGDNSTAIATTAFVDNAIASAPQGVSSFNGRTGVVVLTLPDVESVGAAPLASPAFSGTPSAPTPTPGDNSTRIASTAFVEGAIAALAPIPAGSSALPIMDGTAAIGASDDYARADHVHPTDTSRAAASALANYLPLTGGTLTGGINLTSFNASAASIVGGVGIRYSAYDASQSFSFAYASPIVNVRVSGTLPWGQSGNQGNLITGFAGGGVVACIGFGMASTGSGFGYVNGGNFSWPITLSDPRLKSGIGRAAKDALAAICSLGVFEYDYTPPAPFDAAPPAHWNWGLMADDALEAAIPSALIPANNDEGASAHPYGQIRELPVIGALVKAVQQLTARVEALEAALAAAGGTA